MFAVDKLSGRYYQKAFKEVDRLETIAIATALSVGLVDQAKELKRGRNQRFSVAPLLVTPVRGLGSSSHLPSFLNFGFLKYMVSAEDVLNLVEPGLCFAARLRGDGEVLFEPVERDVTLIAFPSLSVKVFGVEVRRLRDVEPPRDVLGRPRVKRLAEAVGAPPSLGVYGYAFVPLKTAVVERSDSGAELRKVAEEPAAPAATVRAVHAYYSACADSRGICDEAPGGARALEPAAERRMRRPDACMYCRGRRCEIGVRMSIDEEQARQLIEFLTRP